MGYQTNQPSDAEFMELKARLGLQILLATYSIDDAPEGMLDEYMELVVDSPNPQAVLVEYFETFAVRNFDNAGLKGTREQAFEWQIGLQAPMSYSDLAAILWEMTFPEFNEKATIRAIFGNDAV